jgi:hypothetical protein
MTTFILICDDVAYLTKLSLDEESFFHCCKQSPMTLVRAPEGSGWRVNKSLIHNPSNYKLTFPTFYQFATDPPGLTERIVDWSEPSDRIEVVYVKY